MLCEVPPSTVRQSFHGLIQQNCIFKTTPIHKTYMRHTIRGLKFYTGCLKKTNPNLAYIPATSYHNSNVVKSKLDALK